MLKPEQIPDDVWVQVALRLESCGAVVSDYVAKRVAAEVINAWPGMGPIRTDQPIGDWCDKLPAIILPLPQEKTDD